MYHCSLQGFFASPGIYQSSFSTTEFFKIRALGTRMTNRLNDQSSSQGRRWIKNCPPVLVCALHESKTAWWTNRSILHHTQHNKYGLAFKSTVAGWNHQLYSPTVETKKCNLKFLLAPFQLPSGPNSMIASSNPT